MDTKPTNEQAQLHLKVYDLRREARLRQARDWFQQNYHADTVEEALTVRRPRARYIVGLSPKMQVALMSSLPTPLRDLVIATVSRVPRRA